MLLLSLLSKSWEEKKMEPNLDGAGAEMAFQFQMQNIFQDDVI